MAALPKEVVDQIMVSVPDYCDCGYFRPQGFSSFNDAIVYIGKQQAYQRPEQGCQGWSAKMAHFGAYFLTFSEVHFRPRIQLRLQRRGPYFGRLFLREEQILRSNSAATRPGQPS